LLWVLIAGLIRFVGSEVVAVYRSGGRGAGSDPQRWSPTASTPQRPRHLIGRGVAGDWSGSGFPLPDPIVGLIICIAIFNFVVAHRLERWVLGP